MTAKEVWYVWGGEGKPPTGVKKALCQCMVLIDDERYFGSIDSAWDWLGDNPFIQAYTLGETRERVKCGVCEGLGIRKIAGWQPRLIKNGVCIYCQGRGYIWKLGENK